MHAAPATLEAHRRPNLGILSSPDRWYSDVHGWQWAADNGAFGEFDEHLYCLMLDRLMELPRPLFVTVPDVVGDAEATLELFGQWWDALVSRDLPVAFVAQDGLTGDDKRVPWWSMDALFIGGTDEFKLGPDAAELAREARRRGKHVHMGRVSSLRRLRYAKSIGVHSVDGNINNRWRNIYLDRNVGAAAAPAQERLVP